MTIKSEPIVSVAGLRGIVGESFTPEIILPYVAGFADFLENKTVVVGGDSRPSRSWAQPCVESALRARGVNVISVGLAPTPTIGILVRELKAGGGVCITASHNPIQWNGLKFFHDQGGFLTEQHHKKLHALMEKPAAYKGGLPVGTVERCTTAEQIHLRQITNHLPPKAAKGRRKLKIVIDCCNAAASTLAPLIAAEYGALAEVMFNNPGRPFPRGAEPLPENLKVLSSEVKRCQADFGVAIDPDADRLAIVDETGKPIGEERTLVLCGDAYLALTGQKSPLVVNLSSSMAMDHLAKKHGLPLYRSKIGEAHVTAMMTKHGSILGGEGNGGVIIPAIHPGRDAATALALLILGMQSSRKTLSQWNATIPDFLMVKTKVELGSVSVEETLKQARQVFSKALEVNDLDGLKFVFEDSFVHIRPSNTEPILRIFVEAPDKAKAKLLLKQLPGMFK
jgi:phosphomannomutase